MNKKMKGCLRIIWGFPRIRGTLLRVPIIRIIVFWGPNWGPLILGNYHIRFSGRFLVAPKQDRLTENNSSQEIEQLLTQMSSPIQKNLHKVIGRKKSKTADALH